MKLDSLVTVAESRTLDKLLDIMDNASHPLHTVISNQRSLFSERLLLPKCRTNRLKNSFPVRLSKLTNPFTLNRRAHIKQACSRAVAHVGRSDTVNSGGLGLDADTAVCKGVNASRGSVVSGSGVLLVLVPVLVLCLHVEAPVLRQAPECERGAAAQHAGSELLLLGLPACLSPVASITPGAART
ncbi:hypothetical protein L3Q82_017158 [Scortum barcoo]|uniref:Uncharacterized protein n=1 Tax=Scortum barcoo TaxID=214431 RepID=A0ACB8VKB6_9TELE|nr:hypothetical protein L3Q82_017158 [Scortum barcoo]